MAVAIRNWPLNKVVAIHSWPLNKAVALHNWPLNKAVAFHNWLLNRAPNGILNSPPPCGAKNRPSVDAQNAFSCEEFERVNLMKKSSRFDP